MKRTFDVVVVSAFGRGHWLASELSQKGFSVGLWDVSFLWPEAAPEDMEGPFGFWDGPLLKDTQLEFFQNKDGVEKAEEGFTLWFKEGPLSLKGALSSFWKKQGRWSDKGYGFSKDEETWRKKPFRDVWLLHLAHKFSSSFWEGAGALELLEPWRFCHVSHGSHKDSLKWCQTKGVQVGEFQKCIKMDFKSKKAPVLFEFENEVSWGTSFCVLSLNVLEFSKLDATLDSFKVSEPYFTWLRYRFRSPHLSQVFPSQWLWIEDLDFSWTHTNFCVIQRSVIQWEFDVWLRLPWAQRKSLPYLQSIEKDLKKGLCKKMNLSSLETVSQPKESFFPVYGKKLKRLPSQKGLFKNVFFDSVEESGRLDWQGRFSYQEKILEDIQKRRVL